MFRTRLPTQEAFVSDMRVLSLGRLAAAPQEGQRRPQDYVLAFQNVDPVRHRLDRLRRLRWRWDGARDSQSFFEGDHGGPQSGYDA